MRSGDVLSQTFGPRRSVPPFCPIFSRSVPPFCPICKNVKSGRKIEILRKFYHGTHQRLLTNCALYPYLPNSITPTPMKKNSRDIYTLHPTAKKLPSMHIFYLSSVVESREFCFLRSYVFAISGYLASSMYGIQYILCLGWR